MNHQQKFVVWVGLLLIVAMGVYPPWIESLDTTFTKDSATLLSDIRNAAKQPQKDAKMEELDAKFDAINKELGLTPPQKADGRDAKVEQLDAEFEALNKKYNIHLTPAPRATPASERLEADHLKVGPRSGGYHWIFRPPEVPQWAWPRKSEQLKSDVLWNHSLDVPRLLVQWAMVCFVVGGLVWTLKEDKT